MLNVDDLEVLLSGNSQSALIHINGIPLELDLAFPHERRYFLRHYFNVNVPQADIDTLLFKMLIRQGDIVVDAGANIGMTACEILSHNPARVICFEPVPALYKRLCSIKDKRMETYNIALCNEDRIKQFYISTLHNQGSTLSLEIVNTFRQIFPEDLRTVPVQCAKLDSLFDDIDIGFLKVDIEGAEVEFLHGSEKTFKRYPPRIMQIELYEHAFEEAKDIAKRYFGCIYRALIQKDDYTLRLLPVDNGFDPDLFHPIAPTFVFSNVKLV